MKKKRIQRRAEIAVVILMMIAFFLTMVEYLNAHQMLPMIHASSQEAAEAVSGSDKAYAHLEP